MADRLSEAQDRLSGSDRAICRIKDNKDCKDIKDRKDKGRQLQCPSVLLSLLSLGSFADRPCGAFGQKTPPAAAGWRSGYPQGLRSRDLPDAKGGELWIGARGAVYGNFNVV